MNVQLVKEFYVEAAHRNTAADGRASRLHGHSLRIEVIVEGEVDPILGWLIDYGVIKEAFRPLHEQLDHHCLNEIEGMNTGSLGDIAAWIQERLARKLPGLKGVRVSPVGDNAFIPVRLEADPDRGLPPRIGFTFEAAQRLPNLPDGHPCRNLHGHTYRIEVGSSSCSTAAHEVGSSSCSTAGHEVGSSSCSTAGHEVGSSSCSTAGHEVGSSSCSTARDPATLERALESIYDTLDHRCLNDIPDLNDATSERLCAWIWEKLSKVISDLEIVIVQETATARCIYHGQ